MVKHMNETEFDQIKTRIKDLAAMNAVDNAARIERVAIEEALLDSPYKAHLYTEQMFDHLVFLELRELNTKLDKLLTHFAPDVTGGTCNRSCGVIDTSQHLSLIHISEPTRLLSISYAVFCLKKKKQTQNSPHKKQQKP